MSMKRLSRDEAFLIAVNIAKLPSVPRQILKDIPRPPNSASREDWSFGQIFRHSHTAIAIVQMAATMRKTAPHMPK